MYELSGNEAGRGWVTKGDARAAALDLSLVFSEGCPRSTVREEGEMNREKIIYMARDAGLIVDEGVTSLWEEGTNIEPFLVHFANLVAAAEREACAKVLDEMAAKDKLSNYYVVAALAIRERGAP